MSLVQNLGDLLTSRTIVNDGDEVNNDGDEVSAVSLVGSDRLETGILWPAIDCNT